MDKNLKRMATMHRMQVTGLELFYRQGYFNTSVDDILKALGLSKGTFYYHFRSKEDFFVSIVQHLILQKVYSILIEPIEGKQNPFTAIGDCFENALQTAAHNGMDYGFVLGNFMTEFNRRNPRIMKYLSDIYRIWEVNLISALQKGKAEGYVARHVDCEAVSTFLIASYMGLRVLMVEGNGQIMRSKYTGQLNVYFKTMKAATLA